MEIDNPKIKIGNIEKNLFIGIKLINRFFEINQINIRYTLILDFTIDSFGLFFPDKENEIVINPLQFHDTSKESLHALYYSCDFSVQSVFCHEVSHMLIQKFDLLEKYSNQFKIKFILNDNSKKDRDEELAEIFRLYFLNPYFLKIVSPEIFSFFRSVYKSPSECSKKFFISKWKTWDSKIHETCYNDWNFKVFGNKILKKS